MQSANIRTKGNTEHLIFFLNISNRIFYKPLLIIPYTGMASFDCSWCGKCCMSFGEFIDIERKLSERDYYCRYGITNELFLVHIQPEYADEIAEVFEDKDITKSEEHKNRCIFMQKNKNGKGVVCVIYPTRPTICKEFRCYRMLIQNPKGELVGKVIGHNELKTTDEELKEIWKDHIAPLPHPIHSEHHLNHPQALHYANELHAPDFHIQDKEWMDTVVKVLADHGFHGDPVND